jgi:hypothetical protein
MTYILTTNSQGDPETYRKITEAVEAHAHGLIARYAGMNERGLAVTAVWETKADSDRFTSEHLMPAIRDIVGDHPAGESVVVGFDAFDVMAAGGTS